jgi:hypothetical protein
MMQSTAEFLETLLRYYVHGTGRLDERQVREVMRNSRRLFHQQRP